MCEGHCYTKNSAVRRTTILSYEGYSCANSSDIDDNTSVFLFCHIIGISTCISCVISYKFQAPNDALGKEDPAWKRDEEVR